MYRIYGLPVGTGITTIDDFMAPIHPDDRRTADARIRRLLSGEIDDHSAESDGVRHRVVRPDGDIRFVQARGKVTIGSPENPVEILGTVLDVTNDALHEVQRDEALEALAASEEQYRLLAENAYDVIWTMALDGTITYVSPSVERVRGITPQEAAAQTLAEIHPPESAAKVTTYFQELFAAMAVGTVPPTYYGEHEYYRKDGSTMLGSLQVTPQVNSAGQVVQILGVTRDISAQREYEEALVQARDQARISEQRFRTAMVSAPIGMAVVDLDRRFVQVNPALCRMLRRDAGWLLAHRVVDILADSAGVSADAEDREARAKLLTGDHDSVTRDEYLVTTEGRELIVTHAMGLLRDEHGTPVSYVSQYLDITEARRAQDELRYLASHDSLTGLANRAELMRSLSLRLAQRGGDDSLDAPSDVLAAPGGLEVLFMDLDGLKAINDSYGHSVGDAVIMEVAERFRGLIREQDLAARIGGDEFVVILQPCGPAAEAGQRAELFHAAMLDPVNSDGATVVPSLSIGVAVARPDESSDELLARADQALYRAKHDGRNRTVLAP
jgi:diguanylate cyclase (GGDEF)-like protein/PAS domain S-box-containing protein